MSTTEVAAGAAPAQRQLVITVTDDLVIHLDEARDEIAREFNVRQRCFPRWVTEGRLSSTEARDRLDRQGHALEFLRRAAEAAVSPVLVT